MYQKHLFHFVYKFYCTWKLHRTLCYYLTLLLFQLICNYIYTAYYGLRLYCNIDYNNLRRPDWNYKTIMTNFSYRCAFALEVEFILDRRSVLFPLISIENSLFYSTRVPKRSSCGMCIAFQLIQSNDIPVWMNLALIMLNIF